MTFVTLVLCGFTGAACALAGIFVSVFMVRRQRVAFEQARKDHESELQSLVREYRAECSERISQLGSTVALLESGARGTDGSGAAGLTRSLRSQAMQLLRTGASPESAASTLGIGRREMRLIARVSSTLSLK